MHTGFTSRAHPLLDSKENMPQSRPAAPPEPAERLRDANGNGGGSACYSWLLFASLFALLTFNSTMAVYHSKGDAATIAFVATSYLHLVLLSCALLFYERAPPGSPRRNKLKAFVWTLTTLLSFSFAYMVMGTGTGTAGGLTLPVALLVWAIAAATGIGAFSAFFDQGRINQSIDGAMLPPV